MVVLLQACATVANPDRRDPLESMNRSIYGFNDRLDTALVKPVATIYRDVTPGWFRAGVGNFFNNIEDVWSTVNNALQGRGEYAVDSAKRVAVNTTVGLLGTFDIASKMDIDKHPTNFGLDFGALGYWTRALCGFALDWPHNAARHCGYAGRPAGQFDNLCGR